LSFIAFTPTYEVYVLILTSVKNTSMLGQIVWESFRKILASLYVAVITAVVLLAGFPSFAKSASICEEGTEDPPLELRWKALPKPDSLTQLPTYELPLILRNKTQQTLFIKVAVAGALDAMREGVDLGTFIAPPLSDVNVDFDLSQFNFNIANLDFSGRLVARATARVTPSGPVEHLAYTPHAFVHTEGGRIHAYRVNSLLKKFGAGDFGDRAVNARHWAKERGVKLVGIGYVARELNVTDDDGGPRERH